MEQADEEEEVGMLSPIGINRESQKHQRNAYAKCGMVFVPQHAPLTRSAEAMTVKLIAQ